MTSNVPQPLCPKCHFGKLCKRNITFISTYQGQLLVVPNTSAIVCDMCGNTIVDQDMLKRLSGLLSYEKSRRHIAVAQPHT